MDWTGWAGWMDPAEKPSPLRAPVVLKNSILRKSFANGGGGNLVFIPPFFFKDLKGLHGSGRPPERPDQNKKIDFHKTPTGGSPF